VRFGHILSPMEVVTKVKLLPDQAQMTLLRETLEQANQACNALSEVAWLARTFSKFNLQKLAYRAIRDDYGLSAQMAIRCIAKVSHAYQSKKRRKQQFRFHRHGSIAFDARLLSWFPATNTVSIWTVEGRQHIAYTCPQWQHYLLKFQQGETRLQYRKGNFYLLTTIKIETPAEQSVREFIGVDLGLVNLITDSDGQQYSGSPLRATRIRHDHLRQKLQKKGTKSAKRMLKKRSGKERRFRNDVNHCLSKQLVQQAQRTKRGIALEDLKGIRARIRARKPQRTHLHRWAFADLRQKISYKAQRVGVPVVLVAPQYTSQMCASCGNIDQRNRPAQSVFRCTSCGHAAHADVNAAINIGRRAAQSVTIS
jgi:putative transposase